MILALVLAVAGLAALAGTSGLEASGHSAVRSFSQSWAPPGGRLVVTITATNYGGFGQVEETLPEGFSYAGTSLGDSSVTVDGRTVSFVLLGDRSFTYTVEVPGTEGRYTFTGVFSDSDRESQAVGGAFPGPRRTATDGYSDTYAHANHGTYRDPLAHAGAYCDVHHGADRGSHPNCNSNPRAHRYTNPRTRCHGHGAADSGAN